MRNQTVYETFAAAGYALSLRGFSAIDQYLGLEPLPFMWVETDGDLAALARLFEGLRFPGVEIADAAFDIAGQSWYVRCLDPDEGRRDSYKVLALTQDWKTRRFWDPWALPELPGLYPLLRQFRAGLSKNKQRTHSVGVAPQAAEPWWAGLDPGADYYRAAMDGALILARYGGTIGTVQQVRVFAQSLRGLSKGSPPREEEQRVLLTCLLLSSWPDQGLALLKTCGFVAELWPELGILDAVDHAKEFHPEGNVWNHTMETFQYRKTLDLRLSLGLLLHDVGKPRSTSSGNHRFAGHAELGAGLAHQFLNRLGFEAPLIRDIAYLVKNHMLPAALPRLPLARTQEILESPLFPTLLELYRCDESSSFKDLDGYYQSSAAYQAYLRYRRNPYKNGTGLYTPYSIK
ncbi:MAG: HD domain-containing protein [Treponema sp.]|jgi:poly(A) polymerase|nr:HD domain-containing protein [Treponema sp.]